ncbi:RIB43A-like with coiled-coils protein 2 [Oopsacas minuta]|uniref:RIB43A-like with coiled-coils protein 2 n=1 Tax=Oopsacas minuta TaxID=111878 RepID=A0AAV7K3M2_9METZ|nr:RIB43A-like with coiled-coils protein 2 [Oopsacas minuta]
MYKVDLPPDQREKLAVEARRKREEQRKNTIFNARERTMGLDLNAINSQVEDRKKLEAEEANRTDAFGREMIQNDKLCQILDQRRSDQAKDLSQSMIRYRQENQRFQDRLEFDLNDPQTKLKDNPARIGDEDPRLTVSGMQKFAGEDLNYEKRRKLQQEQMREWLTGQMADKQRVSSEKREASRQYELRSRELDRRAVEMNKNFEDSRRRLETDRKSDNVRQAEERRSNRQQEQAQEQDDNFAELSNWINSDLLSENPEVSQSAFGSHRVVTDRWKGFTAEQRQHVLDGQAAQCQEKREQKTQERLEEMEWDRNRIAQARLGTILETRDVRRRTDLDKQMYDDNTRLGEEQRSRKNFMDRELYTNKPSMEYFSQFNTSTR